MRLDSLITTKRELALDAVLADDSTFYGDLFPHAVQWRGEIYLEDGLHRALRAALQQRTVIHVRVLDLDAPPQAQQQPAVQASPQPPQSPQPPPSAGPRTETIPAQPPVPQPKSSRFGRR